MGADTLLEFLRAGRVRRYHTWDNSSTQNIAAHSHGVAVILLAILPNPPENLLRYAILHDLGEVFTGDILGPAKWKNRALKDAADAAEKSWWEDQPIHMRPPDIGVEGKLLMKMCDLLELVAHSAHENAMGNQYAKVSMTRGLRFLWELLNDAKNTVPVSVVYGSDTISNIRNLVRSLSRTVEAPYLAVVQK